MAGDQRREIERVCVSVIVRGCVIEARECVGRCFLSSRLKAGFEVSISFLGIPSLHGNRSLLISMVIVG